MALHFYKYQGAGNDFIVIDNRGQTFQPDKNTVSGMCRRRFGAGADGLMLLEDSSQYDFSMRYFNADGKESTMCGNGGRCMVAFARARDLIRESTEFTASDGPHQAKILEDGLISLKMNHVSGIDYHQGNTIIDTGSPHYVIHVEDPDTIDVVREGRAIRYDGNISKAGINVNFIRMEDGRNIRMRTYERGVEDETMACGTGSIAAAISAYLKRPADKSSYTIHAPGGTLRVSFVAQKDHTFTHIWLTGPAEFVYEGWI